ncbi:major facilitator superfamily domain-containing protein [Aspergillus lucknowensis]|uniref:Major facilitator superfamily domain-containing protein n=1 Tax=Aspergillus lucknowensis TaxID=176173 RepID=A0ABR4LKT5_9EURO
MHPLSPSILPQKRLRSKRLPPDAQTLLDNIVRRLSQITTYTELIYENIRPEYGDLICRALDADPDAERSCARISYNSVTRVLCLRLMPTSLHDVHQRWINTSITGWVFDGLLSRPESELLWSGVGSTFNQFSGMYSGSSKEPDHYIRVDSNLSPRVVVESGWSESFPRLHQDKDLWMLGDPSVLIVILLRWTKISNGRVKGCVEAWRRDTVGNLVSNMMIIFPPPSPLPQTETIQFTKGELFGAAAVPNPNAILEFNIAKLREFARELDQLAGYSESKVGWIFGTYSFFLCFGAAQVGPTFDSRGVLPVVLPGSIGLTISIFCFSESTEYYQILLSFSVLGGISSCSLFIPAISAIGHWFEARRGLATGIACTAGGLGGVFFSLIILYVAPELGFLWAMRTIGIISVVLCTLACLLLKTRLPPNTKAGMAVDLKALRETNYALTALAVWLVEFAVFIPYGYIVSYGLYAGIWETVSYQLCIFLNVGAIPGRALPGILADKLGRFNIMSATAIGCAISTLALWYCSGTNGGAVIGYALLYGFWSGAAISLSLVCISQVCKMEDYGKRNGTTFTLVSLGTLTGIPMAGAIQESQGGGFDGLIIFAGVLYLAAAAMFVIARGVAGGWGMRVKF